MKTRSCPSPSRWFLVVLAGLSPLFVTSCKRGVSAASHATAEKRLLLGNGVEPSTLDPHLNTGVPEGRIINALWDPLLRWNADATALEPAAAERWSVSNDGQTYTFHLRPEARWSNGDPVTADQWVRSLQRILEPGLGSENATNLYDLAGAEDYHRGRTEDRSRIGVRAPDAHTLVLQLRAPFPALLQQLTNGPWMPLHIPSVEAAGGLTRPNSSFTKPGQLITNGPFRLVEWRPNQYVRLEPNPHYRSVPELKEVRFYAIESLDAEERAYRTGQIHLASGVPAAKVPAYQASGDAALRITPRIGTHFLFLNAKRPPFTDARVRRALALAIDRRQLVEAVLRTGELPARALAFPIPGAHQPGALLEESLPLARQLLAEAGFPEGRGFPPVEYLYNTNERNRDIAEAVQQMWRRNLGIQVTLRNEEWKVFIKTRAQGQYDIARAGWLPPTPEAIDFYELLESSSGYNDAKWSHAGFDQRYWEARRTLDPAARYALYGQLDQILNDEMPLIPLAYYTNSRLVHTTVRNWIENLVDRRPWETIAVGHVP